MSVGMWCVVCCGVSSLLFANQTRVEDFGHHECRCCFVVELSYSAPEHSAQKPLSRSKIGTGSKHRDDDDDWLRHASDQTADPRTHDTHTEEETGGTSAGEISNSLCGVELTLGSLALLNRKGTLPHPMAVIAASYNSRMASLTSTFGC